MRNMGVKRPKCRSKFAVMSSVAGVVLLIVGIFLFFAEFSLDDVKTYDGEWVISERRLSFDSRKIIFFKEDAREEKYFALFRSDMMGALVLYY